LPENASGPGRGAAYRKTIDAWCMYDWANSAFVTTIVAALFPPFYRSLAAQAGIAANKATAYWGYTTSLALLIAALLAPLCGAVADHTGGKKQFMGVFAGLGILATASFVFLGDGAWPAASVVFIVAYVGFAGANVFYESLLPHIARKGDIDRVSTRGYALGYVGGGILLAVNVLWIMHPRWFGMGDVALALRAAFLSVAGWWALFSLPFFRRVPEPPVHRDRLDLDGGSIAAGFARLARTFGEIRRYKQLLVFLVAFWIYNDGIGTIIKMATAYGDEIGIGVADMTMALVMTQFVGIPCSFLFGSLAGRIGAKRAVLLGLVVYTMIAVAGYFMKTALHFYILAFMVGTVQGGSQALSRSLYGAMVPKHKSAEFFGFFSTSAKFAGIVGPLLFGLVSELTGASRLSILSVVSFFFIGGLILTQVDVEEGVRMVGEVENERRSQTVRSGRLTM
jgi:UMF1 family MFS transporter